MLTFKNGISIVAPQLRLISCFVKKTSHFNWLLSFRALEPSCHVKITFAFSTSNCDFRALMLAVSTKARNHNGLQKTHTKTWIGNAPLFGRRNLNFSQYCIETNNQLCSEPGQFVPSKRQSIGICFVKFKIWMPNCYSSIYFLNF